eukprot:256290_1
MCCGLRQKCKRAEEVDTNVVDGVIVSESLLKGKNSLIESTSKCLNDLNDIWRKFPKEAASNQLLRQSTMQQMRQCTKIGSPWILRYTPSITDYYDIQNIVGSPGAYGIVKKGINTETGQEVAIKHINKRRYRNRKSQRIYFNDLRSEVYLMFKASEHPHIVNVYHVFEEIDTLYLVMEYCRGGELYDALKSNRKQLSEAKAANLFRQMMASIYYLHSLGIAHCDLKPENFVFKDKERTQLILIDFGMAKIIEFRKYFEVIAGSPYYVAPEVLRNNYNEACDIWSLGICLFVMVFGFAPFFDQQTNDTKIVYAKILHGFDPTTKPGYGAWFPETLTISKECRDLISRMLRTNHADRLTGEEVLEHPWLKNDAMLRVERTPSRSEVNLVQILNPAILNSLRFDSGKKTVLHSQVLGLLGECRYLNKNQIDSLQDFLGAADKNEDGKISPKELLDALHNIDESITLQDVESIFTAIDANNDGYLSY